MRDAAPTTVLIADDHDLFAESLSAFLSTERSIEVVGRAANGEEALRLADEVDPDVILMDISMPTLDGIEAAREIRKHKSDACILMLTGSSISADIDRSRQAGVGAFLTKDRLGTQLLDAIIDLASR
jgi:two-component system, NarL family, nitrate/nitrite response regulator NarL